MSEYPKVSIVIPLPKIGHFVKEAIPHYEKLDYPNFEIIILPDEDKVSYEKLSDKLDIRIVPSPANLGKKRDVGAEVSKGDVIAFTDDDAYPRPDWLKNAIEILFRSEEIGAVGGPAITPDNEPFWAKISGNVFSSFLMSGSARKRFVITNNKEHEDNEIHGVNIIIKKDVYLKVGGSSDIYQYHSGEDTLLCLKIRKAGYKIIFSPNVVVYHHRRSLFWDHFKQIRNYAMHRGFFIKKFPENSLRIQYFLPSMFLVGLIGGGILSFFSSLILKLYLGVLGFYFLLALISSLKPNPIETLLTTVGIFLSHITYGYYFIKGLLISEEAITSEDMKKRNIFSQKRFKY
jgi:GT2 family glycosyltransferase